MNYTQKHWLRYQNTGSLESLWRMASAMNWLSPSEELVGADTLTPDRVSQLVANARMLMEGYENA